MSNATVVGGILRARYRIVQLIGEGGSGAVYAAEDMRLAGRLSAIKEIRPDPYATPAQMAQAQTQFRREAMILARLDHPNLPKVYDFFVEDGRSYLVMDYVDGPDLRQLVDQARGRGEFLRESTVLEWLSQLLDALEYLHNQSPPVIHRDVKPANIKLTPQGRIKLVDFGLVKPLDPEDPRTITVVRGVGSLPYTPLEQYGGADHTLPRSDIYAVGATLYHLLTGRIPVTAQQRFLEPQSLVAPRTLNPAISPDVEKVIFSAMSMHPDQRPSTVAELRAQLESSTDGRDGGTGDDVWLRALRDNLYLVVLVALLLGLAIFATARSAVSPSTVTPTPIVTTFP
ncbi:MAG: serine/threonine-protein kinase [Anaerolineae bacterium]